MTLRDGRGQKLMWWWITARRAHTVLPASLVAFAVLLAVLQDTTADLPAFLPTATASVVVALAAPVPLCAGLMTSLHSRHEAAEDTGVRPVRGLDTGLAAVTAAAAIVVATAVGLATGSSAAHEAGRNVCFLVGIMLCARPLAGSRAVLVPTAWVLAVALGGHHHGRPYVWTVIARPATDPYAAAATALALAAGLLLLFLCSDRGKKAETDR